VWKGWTGILEFGGVVSGATAMGVKGLN
jgi:hypothetical protein